MTFIFMNIQKNSFFNSHSVEVLALLQGPLGQSVASPNADPQFDTSPVPYFRGDWSWNIFYSHSLLSADSRRVGVSYKRKYVQEVLVNRLVELAQENSVVRWTDRLDITIAVYWDVKPQTKHCFSSSGHDSILKVTAEL